MPPLQEEPPIRYVMNKGEVESFVRKIEKEAEFSRKSLHVTHPVVVHSENPFGLVTTSVMIDPIELYNDRKERLSRKECSRCGFYYNYSIEEKTTPIKITGYKGDEIFFHREYEIKYKVVENPNSLDDDFYDICTKCQKEILTGSTTNRKSLVEAERELRSLKRLEVERSIRQNVAIERITNQIAKEARLHRESILEHKDEEVTE